MWEYIHIINFPTDTQSRKMTLRDLGWSLVNIELK